jgi:DNA helicase-2/ATP-dependent DNA helicase PcrA
MSNDVSSDQLISHLNTQQREAVTSTQSNVLVLAGAGSGKTTVLTHRIAWLCQVYGISLSEIMAVTFTNKAAQQMRSRVEKLLGQSTMGLWIGTFHSLCHRLLRIHADQAIQYY